MVGKPGEYVLRQARQRCGNTSIAFQGLALDEGNSITGQFVMKGEHL